ncbi:MAG: 2-amino-4-hydroxy-6-hydroxymethyldihydropteridine diphosphokinase [Dehalococcoidia bacterium]|nr:2-amino-4-hydroxy-6-hydroxymethyldihydropteridine diphosphokinase [Dehalococcoidia bacterium]MDW8008680.1 2-amino-4-hydroxy-6-hydroxymethyldihydropteridine diphosphokinase [Chloroflexota bacterium]
MAEVYLALGSNQGDRAANLRVALSRLRGLGNVVAVSSLYETEPVGGPPGQPYYYNACCLLQTDLAPVELLRSLKGLERELGRQEGPRWGPRVIDLDVLFYDDLALETPELELPHPRLHQRPFVLVPLSEIAPGLRHPLLGLTVAELMRRAGKAGVRRVAGPGWEVAGGGG